MSSLKSFIHSLLMIIIPILCYVSNRPDPKDRKFVSKAVDEQIKALKPLIKNEKLAWMFENCYPNTLDTTVNYKVGQDGKPDSFVITGDINAMWLRDSSAQVFPYLPLVNKDENLKNMVRGLINRQVKNIIIDPYANAFNEEPTGKHCDNSDQCGTFHAQVWERKWELDSLCYPIRLAYTFYKLTNDSFIFDKDWINAVTKIIATLNEQQRLEGSGPYHFRRRTKSSTETQMLDGYGNPLRPTKMVAQSFRPSDDCTVFEFNIPGNAFAEVSMRQLAELLKAANQDLLSQKALKLSNDIAVAIQDHGIVNHPEFGRVYAYEVDGYGGTYFMDDSNVPNLLSLPYLDFTTQNNEVYKNTRKMVWGSGNPFFFKGSAGEGIGGPHVGYDYAWPMSIIMKALTSDNDLEIKECFKQLQNTDGDTGFMHEAFNVGNSSNYTRKWFAWANSLFGELVVKVLNERPHILSEQIE